MNKHPQEAIKTAYDKPGYDILDKVIFIGPDYKGCGGISSVLHAYHDNFPIFHYYATNSRHGRMMQLVNLARLCVSLPFERLRGRRLVHIHGCGGKSWIRKTAIMRWAKLWGYRTIFHCHEASPDIAFAENKIDHFRKDFLKYDAVIVLSDFWINFYTQLFSLTGKIYKLNNIVSHPASKKDSERMPGVLRLLFLGRLGHRKGIFDILEAIAKHKLKNFKLYVGGDGEVELFKNEIKKLGLTDRVEYVGWVTGEKKCRLLNKVDAVILPSYNEGLPITVLEAMAYGNGLIVSPVGGIPEVVDDGVNGLIVEPGDIDGIAAAMRKYIENPALAARHGEASAFVIEQFYPEAVLDSLVKIYHKILDKN